MELLKQWVERHPDEKVIISELLDVFSLTVSSDSYRISMDSMLATCVRLSFRESIRPREVRYHLQSTDTAIIDSTPIGIREV